MDISKILEFHRMVMMSCGARREVDETSCGPLCQHPACWDSNIRREKGVPRIRMPQPKEDSKENDLPTLKFCDLLSDYGESPRKQHAAHVDFPKQSLPARHFPASVHSTSGAITASHSSSPITNNKNKVRDPKTASKVHLVEVQEVFDQQDLNSPWDETFVTKKFMIWVPNSTRTFVEKRTEDKTDSGRLWNGKSSPRVLPPKDLTEVMVPVEIEQKREESILFDEWPVLKQKKKSRVKSPILTRGLYPQTPYVGAPKPEFDSEGIRELLDLPHDQLVQVLDHMKKSDLVSKEKIHGLIQEVLASVHSGPSAAPPKKEAVSQSSEIHTGGIFFQQKVPLYPSRQRNIRGSYTLQQKPVFQMVHDDRNSSASSPRSDNNSNMNSTTGEFFLTGLPHYKKPLPEIVGKQQSAQQGEAETGLWRKIPSVSLGLPELPRGLQQTRAFVYKNKHQLDFTLVPVPTPPQSVRSTETGVSGHGTTLQVNLPSVSDITLQVNMPSVSDARESENLVQPEQRDPQLKPLSQPLHVTMPSATAPKLQSDQSALSLVLPRDQTMSPTHLAQPSGTTPASASQENPGLTTIMETGRETEPPENTKNVPFTEPSKAKEAAVPLQQSSSSEQAVSSDPWPQVTEPVYNSGIARSRSATCSVGGLEKGRGGEPEVPPQRARSGFVVRGSERTNLAKRIMAEAATVETPAPPPPPPSPEPKELHERVSCQSPRDNKSRESLLMEPLVEKNEGETVETPREFTDGAPGQVHEHSITQDDTKAKSPLQSRSAVINSEQESSSPGLFSSTTSSSGRVSPLKLPSYQNGGSAAQHVSSKTSPKKVVSIKKKTKDTKNSKDKKVTAHPGSREDSGVGKETEEERSRLDGNPDAGL